MYTILAIVFLSLQSLAISSKPIYEPRGVGGGGAMGSYSISPVTQLRFVGSDMGTLFKSENAGKTWRPIDHREVRYGSNLEKQSEVGFSIDGKSVFFADQGRSPKRSVDQGEHWKPISVPLEEGERIKYWVGDPKNEKRILCATTRGVFLSQDLGIHFKRIKFMEGEAQGSFWDRYSNLVFHATEGGIFLSKDRGVTFSIWFTESKFKLRGFAGGANPAGFTLAFIDSQGGQACKWAKGAKDSTPDEQMRTIRECGYVWMMRHLGSRSETFPSPSFRRTTQEAGRFIRMAANDPKTIYVTGGDWVRQYGSRVYVSIDSGQTWKVKLQNYIWDKRPYEPWPKSKLEYSGVGLDVGWNDNAPWSFVVNPSNSAEAGGTGNYFLHTTENFGDVWKAPFTEFADTGERARSKRWKSRGLEVTSVLKLKFHPKNPNLGYASVADIGGQVTEDGGLTWRIIKGKYNTNYDFAFDPEHADRIYTAVGDKHDYPLGFNQVIHGNGGIFVSENRGRSWSRLTPDDPQWNRQFLSVGFDPVRKLLYAGTQGGGIARYSLSQKKWQWLESGLPSLPLIIPQIEVDPKEGTVYCLVSGTPPKFAGHETTGIYSLDPSASIPKWKLLREDVNRPNGVDSTHSLWKSPSSFAIDFSKRDRSVLWLTDIENDGAWLASGVWKSEDGGKKWNRVLQMTHPTSISLNSINPKEAVASGVYDMSGTWGQGGTYRSLDGGKTWVKNEFLPLQSISFGFTPDPKYPSLARGYFLFFGGGILYGPTSP